MESQYPGDKGPDFIESVWNRIRTHLENARAKIYEEIRNYPRPVPACDQQFNYLLEERARIGRELDRMAEAAGESLRRDNPIDVIDDFINTSNYIDKNVRQTIRSYL
jgi:hypothetical protein